MAKRLEPYQSKNHPHQSPCKVELSKAFGDLTVSRINRNLRHPLVNIITISICAIICGCDDFCSIEQYGNAKVEWFKGFLDLKHGIPSDDTFSDVLNRLKPKEFSQAFTQWVSQLGNLKGDIDYQTSLGRS